jgi:nucleoside-diphosphate-sugar epimerase
MTVLEPEGFSCKRPRADAREEGTSRKGDAAARFPAIALTGASGFTGSRLLAALLKRGHAVAALVRPRSLTPELAQSEARIVLGHLEDEAAGLEPPLHRRRADFFTKNRAFSIEKARRMLGYDPQADLEEGVRTATWYREAGWL